MSDRETGDVAEATGRLIMAVGRRVGREGNPEGLPELDALQEQLDRAYGVAVHGLRSLGFSDATIGRNLRGPDGERGVSRQAVAQRWPRQPLEI